MITSADTEAVLSCLTSPIVSPRRYVIADDLMAVSAGEVPSISLGADPTDTYSYETPGRVSFEVENTDTRRNTYEPDPGPKRRCVAMSPGPTVARVVYGSSPPARFHVQNEPRELPQALGLRDPQEAENAQVSINVEPISITGPAEVFSECEEDGSSPQRWERYIGEVSLLRSSAEVEKLAAQPPPMLEFEDNDTKSDFSRVEALRLRLSREVDVALSGFDRKLHPALWPACTVLFLLLGNKSYRDHKKPLNIVRFCHALLDSFVRSHQNGVYVYKNGAWHSAKSFDTDSLETIEEIGEVAASLLVLAHRWLLCRSGILPQGPPAGDSSAGGADSTGPRNVAFYLHHLVEYLNQRQTEVQEMLSTPGELGSWPDVKKLHQVGKAAGFFFDQLQNNEGRCEIAMLCRLRATPMKRKTCAVWQHGAAGNVCFEFRLGQTERQVKCSPENDCYMSLNHDLFYKFTESSIRRLKLFLATFYADQGLKSAGDTAPGFELDLCQESLIVGGTSQLPHVVIIYFGPGGNGKTARLHLRNGALGHANGGVMSTSLLFKKDEFRISAGEYINKIHITWEEVPDGDIEGQTFKELTSRTPILTRPPYGKHNEYISWERTGFWWNLNKFFRMGRDATECWARRCKVVDVVSEFSTNWNKVDPTAGKFLSDTSLETFLQSGEAHAIYNRHILLPFMRLRDEEYCVKYLKEPPEAISKRSLEILKSALEGNPAIAGDVKACGIEVPSSTTTSKPATTDVCDDEKELRLLHTSLLAEHRRTLALSQLQRRREIKGSKNSTANGRLTKAERFAQLCATNFGQKYFRAVPDGSNVSGHGRRGVLWELVLPCVGRLPRKTVRGFLGPYVEHIDCVALRTFLAENANCRRRAEVESYLVASLATGGKGLARNYRYKYEQSVLATVSRRICVDYGKCLGSLPREARVAAMGRNLLELDICNCYPTILTQLLSKIAPWLVLRNLLHYVLDREQALLRVMSHYDMERSMAKICILRVLNGGGLRGCENADGPSADGPFEEELSRKLKDKTTLNLLEELRKEGSMAAYVVETAAPEALHLFRSEGRDRPGLTTLSYVLQSFEDSMLSVMEEVVRANKGVVSALLYDSIIVEWRNDASFLASACERRIKERLGFEVAILAQNGGSRKTLLYNRNPCSVSGEKCCIFQALAYLRPECACDLQEYIRVAGRGPHTYRSVASYAQSAFRFTGCGFAKCADLPAGSYVLHQRQHAVAASVSSSEVSMHCKEGDVDINLALYVIRVSGDGDLTPDPVYADFSFLDWDAGGKQSSVARPAAKSAPIRGARQGRHAGKPASLRRNSLTSERLPNSVADASICPQSSSSARGVGVSVSSFSGLASLFRSEVEEYADEIGMRKPYGQSVDTYDCSLCPCLTYSTRQKLQSHIWKAHSCRMLEDGHPCHCGKQLKIATSLFDADCIGRANLMAESADCSYPNNYLRRSAGVVRDGLRMCPSYDQIGGRLGTLVNETAWAMMATGPTVILKADASDMMLVRRGDWYWSRSAEDMMIAFAIDPAVRAQTLPLRSCLQQHFLRFGNNSGMCLPGRAHLRSTLSAISSGSTFNSRLATLHAKAEELQEYTVISVDGTFKVAMSVEGQVPHGATKSLAMKSRMSIALLKSDAPIPANEVHVVLTARGLSGYLVGVEGKPSEGPTHMVDFLIASVPTVATTQTRLLVSDNPKVMAEAKMRSIFPNLECIASDPMHRAFEMEQFAGPWKSGPMQSKLRKVHAKFSARLPWPQEADWILGEDYFGSASKQQLLQSYGSIVGVKRKNTTTSAMVARIDSAGYSQQPFLCREEYFQCIFALIDFAPAELGRKNKKGKTIESVLRNALRIENFLWLLNNAKFRGRAHPEVAARMAVGTCSNEALHREILSWGRCVWRQSADRLLMVLRYFHLAKCLSYVAATMFPTSRAFTQAELIRALSGNLAHTAMTREEETQIRLIEARQCVSPSSLEGRGRLRTASVQKKEKEAVVVATCHRHPPGATTSRTSGGSKKRVVAGHSASCSSSSGSRRKRDGRFARQIAERRISIFAKRRSRMKLRKESTN